MVRHSRVAALAAALFAAAIAAAAAGQTVQIVPIHGAQPKAMTMSTSMAHGMMSSAKHNFVAKHKLTNKKSAMHGFAGAKGNGKGTM
jgi:hypothetical protein